MTTLHQIGELLRSGVRPTDEETEHLKELGGFVAEMYGRFMGGHAEHMESASDLWSGRLARRLSAATGARWEQGIGLAEMLLGSELTSFWQIARDGLTAGYGDFSAEMAVVDLYEEDTPAPVVEASDAAPRRRRGSLFGARTQSPVAARKAWRGGVPSRDGSRQRLENLAVVAGDEVEGVREARDAHWRDGSRAEMAVIRALAAGGLFVGDQVADVRTPGAPARSSGQRIQTVAQRASDVLGRVGASDAGRARPMQSVLLDGLRIDGRTPALAAALARVDTVFGRGARDGEGGTAGAAVSQSRLARLTAGTDYSIDKGFGSGERPVYGFYDAVETTYLNLRDEAMASAAEAVSPAGIARVTRARAARSMPASMQAVRREEQSATTSLNRAGSASVRENTSALARAGHALSLEQVVPGGGALRPFVSGVFPAAAGASVGAQTSAKQSESLAFAAQVTHLPNGVPTVRVQRGGMSAPRYSVVEAARPVRPATARFVGGPTATPGAMDFSAAEQTGAAIMAPAASLARISLVGPGRSEAQDALPRTASGPSATFGSPSGSAMNLSEASFREMGMAAHSGSWLGGAGGRDGLLVVPNEIGGGFVLASLGAVSSIAADPGVRGGSGAASVAPAAGAVVLAGRAGDWRLAIDGGADLPLGATFSRHEVFAGTRASQAAGDMRATRNDFRPVIAGGGGERASELAQALDGMVWVTLPTDTEPLIGAESLGLTAVPSRRRAAMVPAGLALQAIAGVVANSRRASLGADQVAVAATQRLLEAGSITATSLGRFQGGTATSQLGFEGGLVAATAQGRLEGGSLSPAEMVRISQANEARAASRGEALRQEVGTTTQRVEPRQVGRALPMPSSLSQGPTIETRFVQSAGRVSFDATAFAEALRSGFLGNVSNGVRGPAIASEIGNAESPTFAAVAARGEAGSVSLVGRHIEAALRADGVERGLRAARFLDGVVGQGGYGRIESERELLSIAKEQAVPVATETGDLLAARPGRAARRLSTGAIGRAGSIGATIGKAEIRAGVVRPEPNVATVAGRVGASGYVSLPTLRGQRMSTEDAFSGVSGAADARLSSARIALSRAVVTARESRAVASLMQSLSSLVPVGQPEPRMVEGVAPMARDNMLRAVAARGFLEGYKGADEPMLGRLVRRMNASRAEQPMAIANWEVPAAAVERLASLEGAERRNVVRALSGAGWRQPEFQMLRIESPNEAPVGAPGAVAPGATQGVQQAARASRMSRSMARVLSGGEALGGAVDERRSGAAAGAIAQGQSASWLPLLSTGADEKYFGGLAPAAAGGSVRVASLKQALGDLVKMAEAAISTSDTPVALAARREVLRRAATLEIQASALGDRASLTQIMSLAASSRAVMVAAGANEAVGAIRKGGGVSLVDELGGRATAMVSGEQIQGFEDGISTIGSLADGPKIGAGFVDVAQRVMQINEAERSMIELESEAPAGLEARLAAALALSTSGPAGARRMTRAISPARLGVQPAKSLAPSRSSTWSREPDEAMQVRDTVMNGASPERRQVRSGNQARQEAAVREETQRGLSVTLGSVMAPEAMLAGLRSPELSDAIRAVIVRRMELGEDFVPVLTTLADSGVDLTAARSSISAEIRRELAKKVGIGSAGQRVAEMGSEMAGFQSIGPAAEQFRSSRSALASDAPERDLVELMSEAGDVSAQFSSSVSRRQRAGLLSAILRGTERAELTAILEQTGGRQFAMAWLNRVDGTRSGIDIGMKGTRQEFGQAFGARTRSSSVAGQSPMGDASFVDTSAQPEDKSGLRSIAASVVHTATGAARPQHGASQAMRRTDWSFIDTGSKASTTHADLGKLASAIVGGSDSGSRAPMPLVAPAAKAIAQTALRDDKNASASSNSSTGGSSPAPAGSRGPTDAKMSDKAVELLAIEMASRVARLMGLTNERRGIWT